jgi:hypothetical protein
LANISMTEVPLICHAESKTAGVDAISVSITRGQSGEVTLRYCMVGALDTLEIASLATAKRVDGLWKSTCFELFIGNFEDEHYLEYNFSPSRQWAAYQFEGYRSDMVDLVTTAPNIRVEQNVDAHTLIATIALPDAWQERDLSAGVSAVIATKSGLTTYWAAAHPQGKPDFHHKDCFALQLEARSAS